MFKSIAVLALAGSALARPALEARKLKTVVHTVVVTHTAVVTYTGEPKPVSKTPEYTPVPQPKPTPSSKKEEYVVVTPTPKASPPPPPPPAPKSSAAPAPVAAPASDYLGIANEYRVKLGLPKFELDSKLQANALNTVQSSNGKMEHKLNPGSFAQVLAPGKNTMESFKHVYLGGWLCEMPNLPGIKAECPAAMVGWSHNSDGHAKILTGSYKKIGCAWAVGIWSCDCA